MPIELYEHQKTALSLLRIEDGFALFMEQGTGKTFPVLFRLAELAEMGKIDSALIVAPKAVCGSWRDKIELLDDSQKAALESIELEIVNYDLVWRREEYWASVWDALVLDESHFIKTPGAKRTHACLAIAAHAKYRYILTGTPTSNGALCNIWTQLAAVDPWIKTNPHNKRKFVYPACLGKKSYYKWLEDVAYLNRWHKPYKYRDVSGLQDIIAEHSYRITKSECLDLPEKLPDELLRVEIGSKARKDYSMIARHSAIPDRDLLADNPLVRMLRLRQIASGFLANEDQEVEVYQNAKTKALTDLLSEHEGKVVVFCEFKRSIDDVTEALDKMGFNPVSLDGRSKDHDVWRKFQEDPNVRAIVCQYQSGSAGIDLYAASTCVFYEPTLSSNLNEQAKDRIHRIGQHDPCSYYYLIAQNTVEEAIYEALKNYKDFEERLFADYLDEYVKGESL